MMILSDHYDASYLGPKGDDGRSLASRWKILEEKLKRLQRQMSKAQATFAFAFVEVSQSTCICV